MFVKWSCTQILVLLAVRDLQARADPRDRNLIQTGYALPKLFLWPTDWSHYNQLAVLSFGLIKDLMRKSLLPRFQAVIWDCRESALEDEVQQYASKLGIRLQAKHDLCEGWGWNCSSLTTLVIYPIFGPWICSQELVCLTPHSAKSIAAFTKAKAVSLVWFGPPADSWYVCLIHFAIMWVHLVALCFPLEK